MTKTILRLWRGNCLLWLAFIATRCLAGDGQSDPTLSELVGRGSDGRIVTPVNQVVVSAGTTVDLPGLRPQALALSPDGRILVTSGKASKLVVIEPQTGKILENVPLPAEGLSEAAVSTHILKPDKEGQLSYTGLVFSPDGSRLYLANVNGSIKVFSVSPDHQVAGLFSIPLPPANAPWRAAEIPSGLAVSRDGKRLYVVLNLSNRLIELDAATGTVLRLWKTGFAPYDVVLAGEKAFVSNWGGRQPDSGSLTGPAGQGTSVRVDPVHYVASEGSVSVIELANQKNEVTPSLDLLESKSEILTGLHASGLALSPNGRYLVVANAASDNLSVIDTRTEQIVETICARQNPADLFGAGPNALVFAPSGKTLFVCNGTQNAVAVIAFSPGQSKWKGLIPVGWFPGAIVYDARRKSLDVANIKGIGHGRPRQSDGRPEFNSHQYYGSVSLVHEPSASELAVMTAAGAGQHALPAAGASEFAAANRPARRGLSPNALGEPSVFKHVVYHHQGKPQL